MSEWKPNLYVVARFLDALVDGARTRSDLQAAAGVNYDVFRRYLAFLEERGYAKSVGDGVVAITPAGSRTRAELRAWIDRFLATPTDGPQPGASLHARRAPVTEE